MAKMRVRSLASAIAALALSAAAIGGTIPSQAYVVTTLDVRTYGPIDNGAALISPVGNQDGTG